MTDDFDYENVDPETLREWKAELLQEFKLEMRLYLKRFPDATPEEKRELRHWVNSGHSPYENGDYIVNDDGGPTPSTAATTSAFPIPFPASW